MHVRALRHRQGVVLLAVLVIVVLLTLAAYQFSEMMIAEYKATYTQTRSAQARAAAESGVYYTAALLSNPEAFATILGGNPFDNPQRFQGVLVPAQEGATRIGRFTIIAPLDPDMAAGAQGLRFGLTDEAGKINLNALLRLDSSGGIATNMLMMLPGMTEDIANAILDWIDADDQPRASGAENEYYTTLNPPYRTKNAPLDSIEELLLVRGVTPQLLFGSDRNRNGILDRDEDDGSGFLDRGWSAYLTLYSRELNLDSTGQPRIYINDSDLQGLQQKLVAAVGEDLANYIIAYRLYGASGGSSGSSGTGGASKSGGGTSGSPAPSSSSPGKTQTPAPAPAPAPPSKSSSTTSSSKSGASRGSNRISSNSLNLRSSSNRPRRLASVYELINSSVSIPNPAATGQQQTSTTYTSPLNDAGALRQLLPVLLDKVTTTRDTELPARININTAPSAVLYALPGLQEADVQAILTFRPDPATAAGDPIYQTPAWLITDANLSPRTVQALDRYITARTQVYHIQSVGHFDGGGPAARIEAIIDTNGGRPRIVFWRDLTELGRGLDLNLLGDRGNLTGP